MNKADYVLSHQDNPTGHHCHWPACGKEVPPSMWGCSQHWFKLPKVLRDKIWKAYRPGQEITKTPGEEYIKVALEVQAWIKDNAKAER